ncbi:MAG TPA: peptidoglycan-associated lipoprotein Pal [candidate division Zixibacteria bacterium]|nr:peptidoglycan-associated lipoprotein Pal [candidate division Zixibacteria bacterium]
MSIPSFRRLRPDARLASCPTASRWVVLVALLAGGCSSADPVVRPAVFNNPEPVAASREAIRSPSALEALSRGVAAVTPPGAPLKDIYYEFDSTALLAEAQEILRQNAAWLKAHPKAMIEIEGHCDDIGSSEYNLALGAKRAQAAKDFLVKEGIAAERMVTISYGKEAPACFERTEECRVKNRRARFVIFTELPAQEVPTS